MANRKTFLKQVTGGALGLVVAAKLPQQTAPAAPVVDHEADRFVQRAQAAMFEHYSASAASSDAGLLFRQSS